MNSPSHIDCPKCSALVEVTSNACWNCDLPMYEVRRLSAKDEQELTRAKELFATATEAHLKETHCFKVSADAVLIRLSGATEILATHLLLFPEPQLRAIQLLRVAAQEELGGFSSGVGFIGSPEWVLGGAAVLGMFESLITNSKIKKGMQLLHEAAMKWDELKMRGTFCAISEIAGAKEANPAAWRSWQISRYDLEQSLNEAGDKMTAKTPMPINHMHDGGEFVWVRSSERRMAVRWKAVAAYEPRSGDGGNHGSGTHRDKVD